ncbi:MAG: hypothetical protein ABJC61_14895 [Acidobacteriota bacterium]
MTPSDPPERPRAVTVIGWTAFVIAALFVARALIDLVIWRVMRPAIPALLESSFGREPAPPYLRPLLEHLTELKIAQAIFWSFVGAGAIGLLRLRAWARVAMQAACGLLACYCAVFAFVWIRAWSGVPAEARHSGELSDAHRAILLSGALGLCLLFAGGLATVVFLLRGERVKAAFAAVSAPGGAPLPPSKR